VYLSLLLFSCLVYLPLAVGAALRHRGIVRTDVSRHLMPFTWLGLEPFVTIAAFWSLDLHKVADVAAAPLLGVCWILALYLPASLASRKLCLPPAQRGPFLLAAIFSNNGITLGASVCLLLLGEQGQAIGLMFVLGMLPLLLTFGFAIGKSSARHLPERSAADNRGLMSALRIVPYSAIAVGLALNLARVPRPSFVSLANHGLAYVDVAIFSFAIGTLFVMSSVARYLRECLVMSSLKFAVSPVVGLLLYLAATQVTGVSPMLLKAMIVQCAMPVAILSVVVSKFFGLDTELSAACWVFTTLAVAAVVPLLALAVSV